MFEGVNFLAVGLAAVLSFALGALWYSPVLFAKPWMAAHGYTEETLKAKMEKSAGPMYVVSFVCWFVMATVLAMFAAHGAQGVPGVLHTGLILWIGFAATTSLTNNMFTDKPLKLWFIDAGYQVASVVVMSVVLGYWR